MANSKLIVIEGAQGVGKTTVTDYIRHSLSYTNLYRLCGTSDTTKSGLTKATNMYNSLITYIKSLENCSINLLFDRTFFTEEVYCRLGKKDYSFSDVFYNLLDEFAKLDFDIYYITLYLKDTNLFNTRLKRKDKALFKNSSFDINNSIKQQNEYLKLASEIKNKYPNINVYNVKTDENIDEIKKQIKNILNY